MPDINDSYEAKHLKKLRKYSKQVKQIYNAAIVEAANFANHLDIPKDALFRFSKVPALRNRINMILADVRKELYLVVVNGIQEEWDLSMEKNIKLMETKYQRTNFPDEITAVLYDKNEKALKQFIARKSGGLNLSNRVWNATKSLRNELEQGLSLMISEGKSSKSAATSLKKYLNEPDRLFRRVRDAKGKLNPSGPAKMYNPGQGVYRSSYKNALRLTRSETNMAYRNADMERWSNSEIVKGYEVRLSENHPRFDICDYLKGEYPKSFIFNGWHPQCYDYQTEVFTNRGWLFFKDVTRFDLIYSLNPKTKDLEWSKINRVISYHRNGSMVHFKNRSLDLMVTPDHRMVYLSKDGNYRFLEKTADKYLPHNGSLYRTSEWVGKTINNIQIGKYQIDFNLFCEFMGYYLSDGSVSFTRKTELNISQSVDNDQVTRAKIKLCLDKMPFSYWETKIGFGVNDIDFRTYLSMFGKSNQNVVPNEIKESCKEQISIFLDAFVSCDGMVRKPQSFVGSRGNVCNPKNPERIFFTTSKLIADDIGELLLKIGKRPTFKLDTLKGTRKKFKNGTYTINNDLWRIYECHSATASVFNKEYVDYNGMVYDVELEKNHILYVRRNGKCVWGSNCLCYAVPILMTNKEFDKYEDSILNGYKPNTFSVNTVSDVPNGFKEWVENNRDRVLGWKSQPFWVRDNFKYGSIAHPLKK